MSKEFAGRRGPAMQLAYLPGYKVLHAWYSKGYFPVGRGVDESFFDEGTSNDAERVSIFTKFA